MVEYSISLDSVFSSLADSTRRDILNRLTKQEMTVKEVSVPYEMSLAAVSKHLKILERARLITKRKKGKERVVCISPQALSDAGEYLDKYSQIWQSRYEKLEKLLNEKE